MSPEDSWRQPRKTGRKSMMNNILLLYVFGYNINIDIDVANAKTSRPSRQGVDRINVDRRSRRWKIILWACCKKTSHSSVRRSWAKAHLGWELSLSVRWSLLPASLFDCKFHVLCALCMCIILVGGMIENSVVKCTKAFDEDFDVRENWPECKPITTHVRYQTCGFPVWSIAGRLGLGMSYTYHISIYSSIHTLNTCGRQFCLDLVIWKEICAVQMQQESAAVRDCRWSPKWDAFNQSEVQNSLSLI